MSNTDNSVKSAEAKTIEEIEVNRKTCLEKANTDYYDRSSNCYKDNERFSWAVKTINEYHDEKLLSLKPQIMEKLNKK